MFILMCRLVMRYKLKSYRYTDYMPKKLFDDLEEGICTPFKTFNNAAVLCM